MLPTIYLFKFANIFHLNPSNIVHGQIQKQPPEVLCQMVFLDKVFLEISQNLQENTSARVPF